MARKLEFDFAYTAVKNGNNLYAYLNLKLTWNKMKQYKRRSANKQKKS